MYVGMTNNVKPMWAVLLGEDWGKTFAFVWRTEVSQNKITPLEIRGVECLVWSTRDFNQPSFPSRDIRKERMHLLGSIKLHMGQIQETGLN